MPKPLRNITEVSTAMDRFLRERGLKSNDGHYTALTAEDLKTGGWKSLSIKPAAGFMIRYYDVKGGLTDFCRFRYLEQPVAAGFGKLTERERDEFRYVQPAGVSPQIYFPKGQDWNRFFKIPIEKRILTITEGELKADCACKLGIPTIALAGCGKTRMRLKMLSSVGDLCE